MDSNKRYRMLSTGRGAELRAVVQGMTNHPDDLPTKSELRASLAEVYPGEAHAELRETLFDKLVKLAEARAHGGHDLIELRGIADELVLKVESDLAEADRILPTQEEEVIDVAATAQDAENYTTIGGKATRDFINSIPESAQGWD